MVAFFFSSFLKIFFEKNGYLCDVTGQLHQSKSAWLVTSAGDSVWISFKLTIWISWHPHSVFLYVLRVRGELSASTIERRAKSGVIRAPYGEIIEPYGHF